MDFSAAFAATVTVHDAAGHLLASHDGGFDMTAATAGAYYLTVEAGDPAALGSYALSIG